MYQSRADMERLNVNAENGGRELIQPGLTDKTTTTKEILRHDN